MNKIFSIVFLGAMLVGFVACEMETIENNDLKEDTAQNGNSNSEDAENQSSSEFHNGHAYVDLGLPSGTLWATCNVGATSPEDYGDYYAWGETTTKEYYGEWNTYKWCNGTLRTLTKYCNNSEYGNEGFTDNRLALTPGNDVATVNWGGAWRIPTKIEAQELIDNCTWKRIEQYDKNGKIIMSGLSATSKINGDSIFLPAAGCTGETLATIHRTGDYWTSTLGTSYPYYAYELLLDIDIPNLNEDQRREGNSIRPVLSK